jgi:hypothetical protein
MYLISLNLISTPTVPDIVIGKTEVYKLVFGHTHNKIGAAGGGGGGVQNFSLFIVIVILHVNF